MTRDAGLNSDGWALQLLGAKPMLLRTMSVAGVLAAIRAVPGWTRMVLHARMATTTYVGSAFVHGWTSRLGISVFHNGVLGSADARNLPVDSQAIVRWLDHGGVRYALRRLAQEPFANVFMVDAPGGALHVHRSTGGSLYMDASRLNYSTNPIPELGITQSVPQRWDRMLNLKPEVVAARHWDSAWWDSIPDTPLADRPTHMYTGGGQSASMTGTDAWAAFNARTSIYGDDDD